MGAISNYFENRKAASIRQEERAQSQEITQILSECQRLLEEAEGQLRRCLHTQFSIVEEAEEVIIRQLLTANISLSSRLEGIDPEDSGAPLGWSAFGSYSISRRREHERKRVSHSNPDGPTPEDWERYRAAERKFEDLYKLQKYTQGAVERDLLACKAFQSEVSDHFEEVEQVCGPILRVQDEEADYNHRREIQDLQAELG